ncbi:hypothetical protein KNT99_gp83 [Gordonia phage NatB6]|uniref:Uncharacterized protein n=1 Tax=Gordonia phage NatB6 TaxID=2250322 RepID=A0A345L511_9CAUD|nr:hypothetical protein KNT99_gp83 [Gordonia phage NatB6]AXH50363.1 hypothetical protein SEA_NATB6_83 [Gordonia phage NatB6]
MTLTHVVTVRDTVTLRRDLSATGYVGAVHPDGVTVRVSWEGGAGVSTLENIADLFYILPADHVGERHTVDLRPGVPTVCGAGVFTWTDEYGDEYAGSCTHPAGHDGDCAVSIDGLDGLDGLDDERCVACGEPVDYCQGHGEIGDPVGRAILDAHDDGDHNNCHPLGCDDAPRSYWYRFNRPMEREHYVGDLDGLAYHVARLLTVRTVRLLDDGRMVDAGCGMTVGEYGEL